MAAWLNVALLVGTLLWLRIFIALIATSGGTYNVVTALTKKGDGCQVVDKKKRSKTFDRIKKITKEKQPQIYRYLNFHELTPEQLKELVE